MEINISLSQQPGHKTVAFLEGDVLIVKCTVCSYLCRVHRFTGEREITGNRSVLHFGSTMPVQIEPQNQN